MSASYFNAIEKNLPIAIAKIKDGKRRTSRRKFFPGYVLVELETPVTDETLQLIKETPKVTGFVGGGAQPTPLSNLHATLLDKVGLPTERFADSNGKVNELLEPLSL